MAMDEREQLKDDTEQSGAQSAPASGQEEDNAGRMDAAKAFFRALHAGGDAPAPDLGVAAGAEQTSGRSTGPCPSCQRLESQVAETEQKAAESDGLYRRMAADFDNYRRRIDREREDFQAAGIQKAVEALLPALDDIDRAQSGLNAEMAPEKLMESLNLVFNRINRCLEQMGVKTLVVMGEHFDPKFHEPVQEVQTTEFPDGTVIHELRRGYTINDRVIRPALVNVAANSGGVQEAPQAPAEASEAASSESVGEGGLAANEAAPKIYDLSEFEDEEDKSKGQEQKDQPAETP